MIRAIQNSLTTFGQTVITSASGALSRIRNIISNTQLNPAEATPSTAVSSSIPSVSIDVRERPPISTREFRMKTEFRSEESELRTKIETYEDGHRVTEQVLREGESLSAICTYGPDWELQSMILKDSARQVRSKMEKVGDAIQFTGIVKGETIEKTIPLNPNLPWVESLSVGLRSFIASDQNEMLVNEFDTNGLTMKEIKYRKVGIVDLPGYGRAMQIDADKSGVLRFPFNFNKTFTCKCWFNPETGQLLRKEFSIPVLGSASSTLITTPPALRV